MASPQRIRCAAALATGAAGPVAALAGLPLSPGTDQPLAGRLR